MLDARAQSRHYDVIAQAIRFVRSHALRQPGLEEIAAAVHMSPYHLQRVFTEWAGISPKRFLQYVTKEFARQRLGAADDSLSVALDAGLSGTSRLHDLMVSCEAMTPAEIRAAGRGVNIGFGFAPSPFGEVLVAWTARGVCHFAFCTSGQPEMIAGLSASLPDATLTADHGQAGNLLRQIFPERPTRGKIHLVLKGTNFQVKVWEALVHTEFGQVISYRQLAHQSGSPHAQRAVGNALAANTVGFLIPCHRVIRETGEVGNYRWGSERKMALLGWEKARVSSQFENELQY